MTANEIYTILRAGGLSRAGALGMIGNMAAESTINLKPNIVQIGCSKLSDDQYTAAVDNGLYGFEDGIGYGLCQWTSGQRKRNLLQFAKACGVSVGNGEMQCEFALKELLEVYPSLWRYLCSTDDVDGATDRICTEFECPAENNLKARRSYAHQFEQEVSDYTPTVDPVYQAVFPPNPTVLAFQMWMNYNGYAVPINGYKSKDFFSTLRAFIDDMESC